RWRRPAKPAMPTRVDAAMSSSGIILSSYEFQSAPPKYSEVREPSRAPKVGVGGAARCAGHPRAAAQARSVPGAIPVARMGFQYGIGRCRLASIRRGKGIEAGPGARWEGLRDG